MVLHAARTTEMVSGGVKCKFEDHDKHFIGTYTIFPLVFEISIRYTSCLAEKSVLNFADVHLSSAFLV